MKVRELKAWCASQDDEDPVVIQTEQLRWLEIKDGRLALGPTVPRPRAEIVFRDGECWCGGCGEHVPYVMSDPMYDDASVPVHSIEDVVQHLEARPGDRVTLGPCPYCGADNYTEIPDRR